MRLLDKLFGLVVQGSLVFQAYSQLVLRTHGNLNFFDTLVGELVEATAAHDSIRQVRALSPLVSRQHQRCAVLGFEQFLYRPPLTSENHSIDCR